MCIRMYVMYSYNYVAMYVCMYFIFPWQGRTAMADCQSMIINQSIIISYVYALLLCLNIVYEKYSYS